MKVGPIDCPDTLVNTNNQICVTSLKSGGPNHTAAEALNLALDTSFVVLQFNPTFTQHRKPLKINFLDNNLALIEIRSLLSTFRAL